MEIINRNFAKSITALANVYSRKWSSSASVGPPFTRDGDDGCTVTIFGDRLKKDDHIFNATGTTDELSSYIGLVREYAKDGEHSYTDKLKRIQCILMDINACIMGTHRAGEKPRLSARHTKDLEDWITEYSGQLPPLENYVIPGGGKAASSLHVARSICRRAERCVVPLVRSGDVDQETQVYLNRLSDFLLTISRVATKLDKKDESIYVPRLESVANQA
ncbi:corrinoid adenosyltransferase MMAB-like [Bacillus rossius redtenbacheri]|uniref:corrinoid adenosyltransferase MMAB-like n=1 Tax=Bacillus rossius redtenbacheri TaxID=93214 RepID=UPI002FDF068D